MEPDSIIGRRIYWAAECPCPINVRSVEVRVRDDNTLQPSQFFDLKPNSSQYEMNLYPDPMPSLPFRP